MRPQGQQRLYSLRPDPFRELEKWLAQNASCGTRAWTVWKQH
jgi:hypothetical protein